MKYLVKEDRSILGVWYTTFFVVVVTSSCSNTYKYKHEKQKFNPFQKQQTVTPRKNNSNHIQNCGLPNGNDGLFAQ